MTEERHFTTGYFANEGQLYRRTLVHIVVGGKPICGVRIGENQKYQVCANRVHMPYVECKRCIKRRASIVERILENTKRRLKHGTTSRINRNRR